MQSCPASDVRRNAEHLPTGNNFLRKYERCGGGRGAFFILCVHRTKEDCEIKDPTAL